MIYSLVESHVREALDKPENYNDDGSVNWNFGDGKKVRILKSSGEKY